MTTWHSGLKLRKFKKAEIDQRVREAAEIPGHHRADRAATQGPLRRPAPARGRGARHRPQARRLPLRRAAVEPGRQDARADAHRNQPPAHPPRNHDDLRDPRPGGGHDHGRPHRGHEGRPDPAGGRADPALRQPGQHLRGRLHRHPADELLPGGWWRRQDGKMVLREETFVVEVPAAWREKLGPYADKRVIFGVRPEACVARRPPRRRPAPRRSRPRSRWSSPWDPRPIST